MVYSCAQAIALGANWMGERRPLVSDKPVEFEKRPVEVYEVMDKSINLWNIL